MAWVRLRRFLKHLEKKGEVLHINRPVDVAFEAGAIADLLVKNDGPAVVFEQPRLPPVVSSIKVNKKSHSLTILKSHLSIVFSLSLHQIFYYV